MLANPDSHELESKAGRAARILSWLSFIFLGLLLLAFGLRRIASLDLWWHLAAGRWICENLEVPRADIFSHTAAGQPWIDVHWLFQILAYQSFLHFGLNSLILLKTLLFLAAFTVCFLAVRKEHRGLGLAVLAYFGILISQVHFLERPTAFTTLFTALYLWILEWDERQESRRIWILPALHLIWANMHGVAAVGIVMIFLYALANFWRSHGWMPQAWQDPSQARKGRYRHLLAAAGLCLVASGLNPYGIEEIAYAWGQFGWVASDAHPVASLLDELWPAFSDELAIHPYSYFSNWAFTVLTGLSFVANARRLRLSSLLLYAAFLYLFLTAMRNSVLFAVVAIPLAAENYGLWFERLRASSRAATPDWVTILAGSLLVLGLAWRTSEALTGSYYRKDRGDYESGLGVQSGLFPDRMVQVLDQVGLEGNLYNDADFGGYLIWKLYPKAPVFVDGRHEVYGTVAEENARVRGHPEAFLAMMQKYQVSLALIRHTDPANHGLLERLVVAEDWQLGGYDEVSVLFVRKNGRNGNLLAMLESSKLTPPSADSVVNPFYWPCCDSQIRWAQRLSLARVSRMLETFGVAWEKAGQVDRALEAYRAAAATGEAGPRVYYNLGSLELQREQIDEAMAHLKKAVQSGPEYAPAHANLGLCWELQGEFEKAFECYTEAIRLDSRLMQALNHLGRLHALRGNLEEARTLWQRSLEVNPGQEKVRRWLEDSAEKSGGRKN